MSHVVQVVGGINHKIGRVYENGEDVARKLAEDFCDLPEFKQLVELWDREEKLTESN